MDVTSAAYEQLHLEIESLLFCVTVAALQITGCGPCMLSLAICTIVTCMSESVLSVGPCAGSLVPLCLGRQILLCCPSLAPSLSAYVIGAQ